MVNYTNLWGYNKFPREEREEGRDRGECETLIAHTDLQVRDLDRGSGQGIKFLTSTFFTVTREFILKI